MNMDASEGPSLDRDEQIAILRVCKEAIGAACPLFSGLIAGSTRDAVRWGRELKAAGAEGLAVFPPFPTFLGNPVPAEMIYRYHKAIADGVDLPLVAFQFPKAFGPDFPPETLERLATIPADRRPQGSVVRHDEDRRDDRDSEDAAAQARYPDRQRHVHLRGDGDGLRRRADRLRRHRDARADRHAPRGRRARTSTRAFAIWERLGPLARYCWRAPIRDYRPRMKEVLKLQGLIRHATVRAPQLRVDDAERAELARLASFAGLLDDSPLRAVGD